MLVPGVLRALLRVAHPGAKSAISLRACYAMPGTDAACGATTRRWLRSCGGSAARRICTRSIAGTL
eukprot:3918279-Rhodomonas_salina.3